MGDTSIEETPQNYEWALKNGDVDQVRLMVGKNNELVNKALPNGRYPLCIAADYGQRDVIALLVEHGANVNVHDKYEMTPLLSAVFEGHVDCVQYLLEKGADKNAKAPSGLSCYECAETDDIKALLK